MSSTSTGTQGRGLRRTVTTTGLFLFILGDVLGAGVYVLAGKIAGIAGGAVWVPLVVALVLALLTAGSYAELATKYPKAGGSSHYTTRAFGPFVGFLGGWCQTRHSARTAPTRAEKAQVSRLRFDHYLRDLAKNTNHPVRRASDRRGVGLALGSGSAHAVVMDASTVTVNDLLAGHTQLDIECLDRIYLNGYVPTLQVGGQVVNFMIKHLGKNIPSPAVLEKIGTRFRRDVDHFAADHRIPVVRFVKGARKAEVMRPYLARQERTGVGGVAAIGVAQEYQNVFAANRGQGSNGIPWFSFTKADRRVTCFYFYLWDEQFGPGFIKICSYFPYPAKVWVNGHEWAKRQATQAGLRFTALSNGFAWCEDPAALQQICDRLGPAQLQGFFDHWMDRLPVPLDDYDRTFGYWWELSMRQIETSRTIVFDAPRHGRTFVEALINDNLTIGRPDSLEVIFGRGIRRGKKRRTQDVFNTKVITAGDSVSLNTFYKHSRIKQYLKDGRALRIETVINSPTDLGVARRLEHLDELQLRSRAINTRLLDTERAGQGLILASPAFERTAQPTTDVAGRRAPALRFGDPRVMALLGALAMIGNTLGFTNKSLRAQVSMLLGVPYRMNQMSYDLGRLRRKDLITRIPKTNTYALTGDGLRIALFYTKVHDRLLAPLCAADQPPAPAELRHALATIDNHIDAYIDHARLAKAA